MKGLSNEELLDFVIDNNESENILQKEWSKAKHTLLANISAGEKAVKKVAELEKEAGDISQEQAVSRNLREQFRQLQNNYSVLEKEVEGLIKAEQQAAAGQRAIESIKQWILFCEQEKYNRSFCLTEIIKIVDAVQQSKEAGNE
jgi:hypothetical protein